MKRLKKMNEIFFRIKNVFLADPKSSYLITETWMVKTLDHILVVLSEGEWFPYLF